MFDMDYKSAIKTMIIITIIKIYPYTGDTNSYFLNQLPTHMTLGGTNSSISSQSLYWWY